MASLVTRGLGFSGPLITYGLGGGPQPYVPSPYPMRLCWLVLFQTYDPFVFTEFRDRDIYEIIKAIIIATGHFDVVKIGKPKEKAQYKQSDRTFANIMPLYDVSKEDGSPSREFHRCSYDLEIGVRYGKNPETQYSTKLDRLTAIVRNAIMSPASRSLGGYCLPKFTKIGDGGIKAYGNPDECRSLRGEFAYVISLEMSQYSEAD